MKQHQIMSGIWPIFYAYFDKRNQLDREAMRNQMQFSLKSCVPGIAILGLATEVNHLSFEEKKNVINWAMEDAAEKLPIVVTIAGADIDSQLNLASYAINTGAYSLILQPPSFINAKNNDEIALLEFYQTMLKRLNKINPKIPIGIQNAPEYLGVGLSSKNIRILKDQNENLKLLKGEGSAIILERTIAELNDLMPVLNGRGGLEIIENLTAKCSGMIVAPDCSKELQEIYQLFQEGKLDQAYLKYQEILPVIVFVMQSLMSLVIYGKRIAAWRMGFEVEYDRITELKPTEFGLKIAKKMADKLGII